MMKTNIFVIFWFKCTLYVNQQTYVLDRLVLIDVQWVTRSGQMNNLIGAECLTGWTNVNKFCCSVTNVKQKPLFPVTHLSGN